MTATPHAGRGSTITYLNDTDPGNGEFRRAVVTGTIVADPETGIDWLSVVRPDCEVTLIDPGTIVAGPDQSAIDILAVALGALAAGMSEVDERSPVAMLDSQKLLTCFAEAIAPIEYTLYVLVEADPSGAVATVLSWVGSAAAELERGHISAGRSGILMANSAMAELPPADET